MISVSLIFASALTAQITALSDQVRARWAEREIAVFGELVIDFKEKRLQTSQIAFKLSDCSTATSLCFDAERFSLALPATCAGISSLGKKPNADGVVLVGQVEELKGHLPVAPSNIKLLMNSRYPFVIYEYDIDYGIVGISFDELSMSGFKPRADIVNAIKNGSYQASRGKSWFYSRLITFDPFGACKTG